MPCCNWIKPFYTEKIICKNSDNDFKNYPDNKILYLQIFLKLLSNLTTAFCIIFVSESATLFVSELNIFFLFFCT